MDNDINNSELVQYLQGLVNLDQYLVIEADKIDPNDTNYKYALDQRYIKTGSRADKYDMDFLPIPEGADANEQIHYLAPRGRGLLELYVQQQINQRLKQMYRDKYSDNTKVAKVLYILNQILLGTKNGLKVKDNPYMVNSHDLQQVTEILNRGNQEITLNIHQILMEYANCGSKTELNGVMSLCAVKQYYRAGSMESQSAIISPKGQNIAEKYAAAKVYLDQMSTKHSTDNNPELQQLLNQSCQAYHKAKPEVVDNDTLNSLLMDTLMAHVGLNRHASQNMVANTVNNPDNQASTVTDLIKDAIKSG